MSDDDTRVGQLALAFPLHTADRDALRRRLAHKLPSIVPDSVALPCTACGMTLAAGPRIAAKVTANEAVLLCPLCIAPYVQDSPLQNLGNPDSGWEDET